MYCLRRRRQWSASIRFKRNAEGRREFEEVFAALRRQLDDAAAAFAPSRVRPPPLPRASRGRDATVTLISRPGSPPAPTAALWQRIRSIGSSDGPSAAGTRRKGLGPVLTGRDRPW
jgi:hypothetical protein